MGVKIHTEADVADQLEAQGVDLSTIDTVFFSHTHFDHVGDATLLPSTCQIVVGPGVLEKCLPGYPKDPNSPLCGDAFENRDLHGLDFSKATMTIAGLLALDWFGDGSFYILDTPGHAIGHISALARTQVGDQTHGVIDTFMLLACDVCHHMGELRPSQWQLLPENYSTRNETSASTVLASDYRAVHPHQCVDRPFYRPAPGGFNLDSDLMQETLEKVAVLDSDPRILTVLSHDVWIMEVADLFPLRANDWYAKGWSERSRWKFLQDFKL